MPDATPTPATVDVPATVGAVTLSTGSKVIPSTVGASTSIPTPGAVAGSTITPATVAGVASIPVPVTSGSSGPTPATVAGVATVGTPVVTTPTIALAVTVMGRAAMSPPVVVSGSRTSGSVAVYALGRPLPPARRGGDCRARDLNQGRNVHGRHRFVSPAHCQISNGLLTVTVGASGAVPSLTIEGHRGVVVVDDFYEEVYTDLYGGSYSTPEWLAGGTLAIDSPDVAAVLTAVRIARISAESVILRLRAPLMGDAYVVLRRGERMVRIQHGSTRAPLAEVAHRIRWNAMAPGYATSHRIEETPPAMDSFPRFVAAIDPVTADGATFSLTSADVRSARFGAGIGTRDMGDRPIDMHRQMGDASRPRIVVTV